MCLQKPYCVPRYRHPRPPDCRTRYQDGNWKSHLNNSPSLFVNAAAWGLLTGKLTAHSSDTPMSPATQPPY